MKKVIELEIIDDLEESGVEAIALVDSPAIEKNWLFFRKEKFIEPKSGESQSDYMSRCVPFQMDEGKEQDQAVAICISTYENMNSDFHFASEKISFDYDDTFSTEEGFNLAKEYKDKGDILYIISARDSVSSDMIERAGLLDIPKSRIFATGSNANKVAKIKELGIVKHIDNNADVIKDLDGLGIKFGINTSGLAPYVHQTGKKKEKFEDSFSDYPESVKNNAKKVLEWVDQNGWGSCGTGVGKARANQLANGEAISLETIKRMYSYLTRHEVDLEVSKSYEDGCGKLMYDAWGGKSALSWSKSKLEELGEFSKDLMDDEEIVTESVNFEAILELAGVLGFSAEDIKGKDLEFHSEEEFDVKLAKGYTVYKYSGSVGENTRDFCRRMVNLDRFYTYEEVAQMGSQAVNPGFGEGGANTYSIWKYKGGPNCKHAWRKFYITETGAMQNKGLAPGTAGEQPYDMPNRGYVNPPSERFMAFADESKRELVGPVAIPNIEIPRKSPDGELYFVKFSENLVKRMSEKFLKDRRTNSTNIQHIAEDNAGTYITQSWIVEDPSTDKANTIYNLDVPAGTWMVAAKVTNEETWQKVKAGDLKGFSLEGSFVSREEYEDYMKDKKTWDSLKELVSKWS